eukprot:6915439-Heterocapsa_arctica.AAC.1
MLRGRANAALHDLAVAALRVALATEPLARALTALALAGEEGTSLVTLVGRSALSFATALAAHCVAHGSHRLAYVLTPPALGLF